MFRFHQESEDSFDEMFGGYGNRKESNVPKRTAVVVVVVRRRKPNKLLLDSTSKARSERKQVKAPDWCRLLSLSGTH